MDNQFSSTIVSEEDIYEHTCSSTKVAWSYFLGILGILVVPILIYVLYKYVEAHKKDPLSKYIYIVGILFYIFTLFCFFSMIAATFMECSDLWIMGIYLYYVLRFFYLLHWNLVYVLLFGRLYRVFLSSKWALSKCCIYTFISLYITYIAAFIIGYIFIAMHQIYIALLLFVIGGLCMVIIPIYVSYLFVSKLIIIYRSVNNNDDGYIVSVITKNTILAIFCNSTSLAVLILSVCFLATSKDELIGMLSISLLFLDLFSNFFCISLSYKYADKYYESICGHLDNWCRTCFDHRTTTKTERQLESYTANSSQTPPEANSDLSI